MTLPIRKTSIPIPRFFHQQVPRREVFAIYRVGGFNFWLKKVDDSGGGTNSKRMLFSTLFFEKRRNFIGTMDECYRYIEVFFEKVAKMRGKKSPHSAHRGGRPVLKTKKQPLEIIPKYRGRFLNPTAKLKLPMSIARGRLRKIDKLLPHLDSARQTLCRTLADELLGEFATALQVGFTLNVVLKAMQREYPGYFSSLVPADFSEIMLKVFPEWFAVGVFSDVPDMFWPRQNLPNPSPKKTLLDIGSLVPDLSPDDRELYRLFAQRIRSNSKPDKIVQAFFSACSEVESRVTGNPIPAHFDSPPTLYRFFTNSFVRVINAVFPRLAIDIHEVRMQYENRARSESA